MSSIATPYGSFQKDLPTLGPERKQGFIVLYESRGDFNTDNNIKLAKKVGLCHTESPASPAEVIRKAEVEFGNLVSTRSVMIERLQEARDIQFSGEIPEEKLAKLKEVTAKVRSELIFAYTALGLVREAYNTLNEPELPNKVSDELKSTLDDTTKKVTEAGKKMTEAEKNMTEIEKNVSEIQKIIDKLESDIAISKKPAGATDTVETPADTPAAAAAAAAAATPAATPAAVQKTYEGTAIYSGNSEDTAEQDFRGKHKKKYVAAAIFANRNDHIVTEFSNNAKELFEKNGYEYMQVTDTEATVDQDMGSDFLTIKFKFKAPDHKEEPEILKKMFESNLDKFKLKQNSIEFTEDEKGSFTDDEKALFTNDGNSIAFIFTHDGEPTRISLKEEEAGGGGSRRKRNKRKRSIKRKPRKRSTKRKPRKTISRKPRKTVKRKSNRRVKTRRKRR